VRSWPPTAGCTCGSTSGSGAGPAISFTALTVAAAWEARANLGYAMTVQSVTYTAVGASSVSVLPPGSFIAYGGQNELPTNPNNGSNTYVSPEFDSWASTDGVNWSLIGGYTLAYGNGGFSSVPGATSISSQAATQGLPSFTEGQNSMKCTDKNTGRMYLLSGAQWQPATHSFGAPRPFSYTSIDGQTWVNLTSGFVPPARLYGRCLVDSSSRLYILGSRESAAETEGNDVWMMIYNASTNVQTWSQQTAAAQWFARDSPGADTYTSAVLNTEIMTLAGGYTTTAGAVNDVWASSDLGKSWVQTTANAPWQPRDHGVLLATQAGVLIVTAGGFGEYQTNDLWISLDGGITWGSCSGTNMTNSMTEPWPARKDPAAFLDSQGYLYISGGLNQYYSTQFSTGVTYQALNDLWKSNIAFNNVSLLASLCHLTVPSCGVGVAWSVISFQHDTSFMAPPLTHPQCTPSPS
jgi:hypothetical protein